MRRDMFVKYPSTQQARGRYKGKGGRIHFEAVQCVGT